MKIQSNKVFIYFDLYTDWFESIDLSNALVLIFISRILILFLFQISFRLHFTWCVWITFDYGMKCCMMQRLKWSLNGPRKKKIVLNLNWYVDYDMRTVGCFLFICIGLCKYSKPNNSHSSLFKNECVIKRQNSYNNKKRVCVEAYTAFEVEWMDFVIQSDLKSIGNIL